MKPYVRNNETTKLPGFPLFAALSVAFLDSFCLQIVTPQLPFMVKDFYPQLDDTELGYYSGFLSAAYSLGNIPGSLFWGWFSDEFGRRTCFLTSLILCFICMNIFGFCPDFWSCLIVRTLWGFFCGFMGTAKTYISEICNSKTQGKGFSFFIMIGGVSNVLGPSLGGILSKPTQNMPWLVDAIPYVKEIPYYIPCFVGSILTLIIFLIVLFGLPETLPKNERDKNRSSKKQMKESIKSIEAKKKQNPDYEYTEKEIALVSWKGDNYGHLFTEKNAFLTCALYGIMSFLQGMHDAVYPLWVLNPRNILNGFEMDQTATGFMYAGNALAQILDTPLLLPLFATLFNYLDISFWAIIIFGIVMFITPVLGLASYAPAWLQWFSINVIYSLDLLNIYTSIIVLVSNSTFADFRSKVNGIGQVYCSIGRFIGPVLASSLFAWSVTSGNSFPFDYGFTLYVTGILSIASAFWCWLIPKSCNVTSISIDQYAHEIYTSRHPDIEMNKIEETEKKEESKDATSPTIEATNDTTHVSPIAITNDNDTNHHEQSSPETNTTPDAINSPSILPLNSIQSNTVSVEDDQH
ncbi:hypothetical protein WA158_001184 [Blastocystis sp. Blastoise]